MKARGEDTSRALRLYWLYTRTEVTGQLNGLVYFLRKLPLLGRRIPAGLFGAYATKQVLIILLAIGKALLKVVFKAVWLAAAVAFSFSVSDAGTSFQTSARLGIVLWLFLVAGLGGLGQAWPIFLRSTGGLRAFLVNFQVSRTFMVTQLGLDILKETVAYLPASLVVGLVAGRPLLVLSGPILYAAVRLGLAWLGTVAITYWWKRIRQLVGWLLALLIAALGTGCLSLWAVSSSRVLTTGLGLLISLPIAALAAWGLLRAGQAGRYSLTVFDTDTLTSTQSQTAQAEASLNVSLQKKMTADDLPPALLRRLDGLRGSNYLNALLFWRYRRTLRNSLLIRLGLALLAGTGLLLAASFAHISENDYYTFLPGLFFYMYVLSFGKKLVQICFVNCDCAMLHYPFYRTPKVILAGFNYRLRRTAAYNGWIAGLSFLFIIVSTLISFHGFNLRLLAVVAISFLALILLFSFHELFIYYLLQPFTEDMTVNNPLYTVISGLFYGFAYLNLRLQLTGATYLLAISGLSILYVLVGYYVIGRKAPQTFALAS